MSNSKTPIIDALADAIAKTLPKVMNECDPEADLDQVHRIVATEVLAHIINSGYCIVPQPSVPTANQLAELTQLAEHLKRTPELPPQT